MPSYSTFTGGVNIRGRKWEEDEFLFDDIKNDGASSDCTHKQGWTSQEGTIKTVWPKTLEKNTGGVFLVAIEGRNTLFMRGR
ncbi:hypothetical protein PG994_010303 [Apiospora phragmitis]|uniref:Uncharacterized protein n=1 Tax=Apiospora phragmitis TaxID=2905665 RepID=A0ABR1TS65_9PEZI